MTIYKKHDVVIFISNPFGFGPSTSAISIMEELGNRWNGNIVYGASKMCQELLPNNLLHKISVYGMDERNSEELKYLFKRYIDPLVFVSLNRVAIKTAKLLGLKSFFLDSLTWLWKKIPEEYLLADTYYCFNTFDVLNKIPQKANIKVISPILGSLPKAKSKKSNKILLHIGGFKTPFIDKLSKSYLLLLSEALNSQNLDSEIMITGGSEALSYLRSLIRKRNIKINTLNKNIFLDFINNASHFVTTPGLMSSFEAFSLLTPTSFMLPSNLSQWRQLKLFEHYRLAPKRLEWEDYLNFDFDFYNLTEKEAIPIFYQLADALYKKVSSKKTFVEDMISLLQTIPDNTKQKEYMNKIGTNGAKYVVADLLKLLV